jgi:hypothetical protein
MLLVADAATEWISAAASCVAAATGIVSLVVPAYKKIE